LDGQRETVYEKARAENFILTGTLALKATELPPGKPKRSVNSHFSTPPQDSDRQSS
jgi:hypothetical protein